MKVYHTKLEQASLVDHTEPYCTKLHQPVLLLDLCRSHRLKAVVGVPLSIWLQLELFNNWTGLQIFNQSSATPNVTYLDSWITDHKLMGPCCSRKHEYRFQVYKHWT